MATRIIDGAHPGEIPSSWLETGAFNTGGAAALALKQNLPYLVVYNTDTAPHVLTATPRAPKGVANASPAPSIPAGGSASFPTSVFAQVSDGTPNGTVFWFYSDVLITGPSSGAGGAATVASNFNETITPNANATEQMAGLGSTLTMTPTKSGNVLLIFTVQLIPGAGDSCLVTARFGTGTAPVLNAAATGTLVSSAVVDSFGLAAANLDNYFAGAIVITGLTVGTKYWIDLGVRVTAFASDSVFLVRASISELPS